MINLISPSVAFVAILLAAFGRLAPFDPSFRIARVNAGKGWLSLSFSG